MKILAITCYTGNEDLCAMTEDMLGELEDAGIKRISSVAQGAERLIRKGVYTSVPDNVGFAYGMNLAIEQGIKEYDDHFGKPDYILCLNNDLSFPEGSWLKELKAEAHPTRVCVPAANRSAIRIQGGPVNGNPLDMSEMSAYAWLVPFGMCEWLKKEHGFWLFDEDFAPAYGEDNWTAFLIAKKFGANRFRYVRRSFVHHYRARTSRQVKHDRRRTNAVLVRKLKAELQDPNLRADLRQWADRYIAILSSRT